MDDGGGSCGSSNRDLKKKLAILDSDKDDCGLELSLGLGLSCGGSSSSASEKRSAVATGAAATGISLESGLDGSGGNQNQNQNQNQQGMWLDARRKAMEAQMNGVMQMQQAAGFQLRLREFLGGPDTSGQIGSGGSAGAGAGAGAAATAWGQLNNKQVSHSEPASKLMHPSGIPMSMGDLAKYLGGKPPNPGAMGHQQQQVQAPPHADREAAGQDEEDHDSAEQQKKFTQHQEARKKRKMVIDEQKLQKKAKDDDKPDGVPESLGLPPIHRVASLGAFQNRALDPGASSMAVLTSQLMSMRRTISDPTFVNQANPKDDASNNAAAKEASQEAEAAIRALEPNGVPEDTKQLLGMWQLGTTVDMPSAESINPELSSMRPGSVGGQIGGTGSSPDLPWVSATSPSGKTISGVAYKLFQGQYKIVCSCHGLHMSPTDFVKHAGNLDGAKPLGGEAIPALGQVTPA